MRIQNILGITNATLLGKPSVSAVANITTDISKLKKEDLFISNNKKDLKSAIEKGAYAIVTSLEEVLDEEIAHFLVEDINNSILRFIRYFIVQNDIEIVVLNTITNKLLQNMTKLEDIYILEDLEKINFNKFKECSKIILSKNQVKSMSLEYEKLKTITEIEFLTKRFFDNSILVDHKLYKSIKLPFLFSTELNFAISFCKKYNLEYSLNKTTLLNHFEPIFVNKFNRQTTEIKSSFVVICEQDQEYFEKEIEFLEHNAKHLRFKTMKQYKFEEDRYDVILVNSTSKEVKERLSKNQNEGNSLF